MIQFNSPVSPLSHQSKTFDETWGWLAYAIFWDMGAGKTKHSIDLAAKLYCEGYIDAVLVIAPNGVHSNWDVPGEGVRKHLQEDLLKISERLTWHSTKSKHKSTKTAYSYLLKGQFSWLFMAFDAVITKDGYKAIEEFIKRRKVFVILDEATRVKNSKSQRSKELKKIRDLALKTYNDKFFRRILTGTPCEQKPFDVYNQIEWLMPGYWREQGLGSYFTFKHHFAEWRKMRGPNGHEFEVQKKDAEGRLVYKNLDELQRMLRPISSRVRTTDVVDLPPKRYQRLYYELTPKQRKLYDELEKEFVIWFKENSQKDENGTVLSCSAELAIVRQMRLHQLALGYITADTGEIADIFDPNPALELLRNLTEDMDQPTIIWGCYRKDIELICEMLGDRVVRYDGTVSAEDRVKAIQAFQNGDVPYIAATQATMAEGVTLTRARTSIYYSNSRKLGQRRQSEARNYRIGQVADSVLYIDLLAQNTISEIVLDSLIHGEEVAAAALGDRLAKKYE